MNLKPVLVFHTLSKTGIAGEEKHMLAAAVMIFMVVGAAFFGEWFAGDGSLWGFWTGMILCFLVWATIE